MHLSAWLRGSVESYSTLCIMYPCNYHSCTQLRSSCCYCVVPTRSSRPHIDIINRDMGTNSPVFLMLVCSEFCHVQQAGSAFEFRLLGTMCTAIAPILGTPFLLRGICCCELAEGGPHRISRDMKTCTSMASSVPPHALVQQLEVVL